jgi:hypothetical protein
MPGEVIETRLSALRIKRFYREGRDRFPYAAMNTLTAASTT